MSSLPTDSDDVPLIVAKKRPTVKPVAIAWVVTVVVVVLVIVFASLYFVTLEGVVSDTVWVTFNQSIAPFNGTSWNSSSSALESSGKLGGFACYAPPLAWGPVCTSTVALAGNPVTGITYWFSATRGDESAIFCRVLGHCCGWGFPCCWGMHPHPNTGTGAPAWYDYSVLWGANFAYPQIQSYSSSLGGTVEWGWSSYGDRYHCLGGDTCSDTNQC